MLPFFAAKVERNSIAWKLRLQLNAARIDVPRVVVSFLSAKVSVVEETGVEDLEGEVDVAFFSLLLMVAMGCTLDNIVGPQGRRVCVAETVLLILTDFFIMALYHGVSVNGAWLSCVRVVFRSSVRVSCLHFSDFLI